MSMDYIKKGFGLGVGLFLGITTSALMALTVSGIIHTFLPGQAVSSSQINQNFASLKSAIENLEPRYSADETLTQKVWTDGSPIYRKVISLGNLPNNSINNIAHGIGSISAITSLLLIGQQGASFTPFPASGNGAELDYSINQTNVVIRSNNDFTTYTGILIIEYVK